MCLLFGCLSRGSQLFPNGLAANKPLIGFMSLWCVFTASRGRRCQVGDTGDAAMMHRGVFTWWELPGASGQVRKVHDGSRDLTE